MEEFDAKGTVRLTKEGEVRWTTFSIFHGVERWRSEGVQIGGVRSARGVVGNWFDRYAIIHLSWDDSLTLAQRLRYPRPCGSYSVLEGCDARTSRKHGGRSVAERLLPSIWRTH